MIKSKTHEDVHPSFDIVKSHSSKLAGKKIVLCVTGSVAAYKAIELARMMMRHGAKVTCVASDASMRYEFSSLGNLPSRTGSLTVFG